MPGPLSIFKVCFAEIRGMSHPLEMRAVMMCTREGLRSLPTPVSPARAQLPNSTTSTSPGRLLTTAILIAVVPAIIVSVTLPLGGDAGTLAESTHCTCEVASTTSTLQAAGEAWAGRRSGGRQLLSSLVQGLCHSESQGQCKQDVRTM